MRVITTRFLIEHGEQTPVGRVSWSGYEYMGRGQLDVPLRPLRNFALVYLLEGEGRYFNAAGAERAVRPGDLIVTVPGSLHGYGPLPGGAWSELYIIFDGPIFDLWHARELLKGDRPVRHLEPIDYWMDRMEAVVGPPDCTGSHQLQRVCRLLELLADIADYERDRATGAQGRAWLQEAYRLMEQIDLRDPGNFGAVLTPLQLSYAGFRKHFTRLAGRSPRQYLAQLQVRRVSALLTTTDLKLRQIAEQCGFTDEFHLSKRFKQLVGITPREYRRRLPPRASGGRVAEAGTTTSEG